MYPVRIAVSSNYIRVERLPTVFSDACHADGTDTRSEVHTAVLLKIQVLWDVILCQGE